MRKGSIIIDNPSNLALVPIAEIIVWQSDFKSEMEPEALKKLMRSILDHHVFIAKAIFYEGGIPYTEDGHQTLRALQHLKEEGYSGCEVVHYKMKDGRMMESAREAFPDIRIPCQVIVPQGDTPDERKKDAAAKLLQINSVYARINPGQTFLFNLGMDIAEVEQLIMSAEVPGLVEVMGAEAGEASEFEKEFQKHNDDTALYPLTVRFMEKYDAFVIVSDNETDTAFLKEALGIQQEESYRGAGRFGEGAVVTARRFEERWKSRSLSPAKAARTKSKRSA